VTISEAAVVILRPVGPGDEDFLFCVYASTRAEELALVPWTAEQKEVFLRQQFHAQSVDWGKNYSGADFSIIEVEGVPAGRFYVDRGHEEIRLVDIALLPDFRRNGIGTGLIRDLLAKAQAQGVPVTIHVEVFNPARALYERLGFEKVEDRGMYVFMRWRPAATKGGVS
jgi:ribosomal protein S18 acetylase RimI-like enzyme